MKRFESSGIVKKSAQLAMAALLAGSLFACGSDRDSAPPVDAVIDLAGVLTGVFVDSPVAGLSWETSSGLSGQTNAAGEFQYREDDTVTFRVGVIELGSIKSASRITPFDLVGFVVDGDKPEFKDFAADFLLADASDTATKFEQGLNMLIFLQSLDDDNDARNGIAFPLKVLEFFSSVVTSVLFNRDTRDFVQDFLDIFLQLVTGNLLSRNADDVPVNRDDALEHFLLQQL